MRRSGLRLGTALVFLAALPSAGFSQSEQVEEPSIERGHALVIENCSGCHAVGPGGESPHAAAPPFRALGERFPIDALEETFIDSIDTGHPGMPVFLASPQQIADILEYIATVMRD